MSDSSHHGAEWAAIHDRGESWRRKIIGDIDEAFVVPRYVSFFYESLAGERQLDFCEVGSGNGDLSVAVVSADRDGVIHRYVASEQFDEGVEWLRGRGLEAELADAESLPWTDRQFDVAVEFDVMHHVGDPRAMAREMMRVARGRCLMVESNGLSIFRKLKELTPNHRAAGERSYTPRGWKRFFERQPGYEIVSFEIAPFLFPFRCPRWFLPVLVWFNRLIEGVPVLRWQCSSVMIRLRYRRASEGAAE